MTYRIITTKNNLKTKKIDFLIEQKNFLSLDDAIFFLQEKGEIDIEYIIVKDVKIVKFEMQKVLTTPPEIDNITNIESKANSDSLSMFDNDNTEEEKVSYI